MVLLCPLNVSLGLTAIVDAGAFAKVEREALKGDSRHVKKASHDRKFIQSTIKLT